MRTRDELKSDSDNAYMSTGGEVDQAALHMNRLILEVLLDIRDALTSSSK